MDIVCIMTLKLHYVTFILNKLTKNIINMFNTLHVAHDITGHSTIAQKKLHFNVFDFFLC